MGVPSGKEVRELEEEGEESTCPVCNSAVHPDETECYLCGAELHEEGLNYESEDDDEEFDYDKEE